MNKEDVKKGYLAAMATMEVNSQDAEQYWESYESSQHWSKNQRELKNLGDIGYVMISLVHWIKTHPDKKLLNHTSDFIVNKFNES